MTGAADHTAAAGAAAGGSGTPVEEGGAGTPAAPHARVRATAAQAATDAALQRERTELAAARAELQRKDAELAEAHAANAKARAASCPAAAAARCDAAARGAQLRGDRDALAELTVKELEALKADQEAAVERTRAAAIRAREADAVEKSKLCTICERSPRDCVLTPCGHTFCRECAERLATCANCRGPITSRTRVFL